MAPMKATVMQSLIGRIWRGGDETAFGLGGYSTDMSSGLNMSVVKCRYAAGGRSEQGSRSPTSSSFIAYYYTIRIISYSLLFLISYARFLEF